MNIIIKILMCILFLFVIPFFLGVLFLRKNEKNKSIFLPFILGYILEFATCQILAVPMIFLELSFSKFFCTYICILLMLFTYSLYGYLKNKEIISFDKWNKKDIFLTIIVVLLIVIQVYGLVGFMHEDSDDAFYVGTITTTLYTDTLYKNSPTTGEETGEQLLLRYRLGPFPLFYAILSRLFDIEPAILVHTIIPAIFIPLTYCIYYEFGKRLFNNDKKKVLLFLMFISILSIFGNYSRRTNFSMLLFRIWQGKAVLANIIIPATWLIYFIAKDNKFDIKSCLLMFILNIAGVFTTTLGVVLPTISLVLLCFVNELLNIKIKNIKAIDYKGIIIRTTKCCLCCIPSLIYGLVYLLG